MIRFNSHMRHTRRLLIPLFLAALVGVIAPISALAATAPNLGTDQGFAILAGSLISSTGGTVITGDVGLSPGPGSAITGLTSLQVTGTIYAVDGTAPPGAGAVVNPGLLTQAKADLVTAFNATAAQGPGTTVAGGDLTGLTLTPGVYSLSAPPSNLVGTVTLNGPGVFIFISSSSLITSTGARVVLTGGASPCNVFWLVNQSATLNSTTTFVGTIMALTSIAVNNGVNVNGRLLARNGAVTLINDVINTSPCGLPGSGLPGTGVPGELRGGSASQLILIGAAAIAGVVVLTAVNMRARRRRTT
jgi:Ice-binding-like